MKNILIIGAHYDDTELGAGGTAAKLVQKGMNVYKLTLTDNVTKSSHLHINVDYETSVRESAKACAVSRCEGNYRVSSCAVYKTCLQH